jgi:hypothetical protein
MNFFDIYPLGLAVIFVFVLGWLLPKNGKTYDILKLRLELFPHWFKWLAGSWLVAIVVLTLLFLRDKDSWIYFLLTNIDFALFILLFSKQKSEDEFSEYVRLKAFVYAFVSFVGVVLIYGAMQGSRLVTPVIFSEFTFVLIFMGIALLLSLIYFYVTAYASLKKKSK